MTARVAIVTGASSGIGRATAVRLAADGYAVLGVARSAEPLATLAAETGIEVLAETAATADGCARIVATARERLGPITAVVAAAGLGAYVEAPIQEITVERFTESLAVHLEGPFHLIRLAAADLIAAGHGRVVAVSSTAGQVGGPAQPGYCASKHGVIGLIRAAAWDLGPHGVTCNAVLPGWVDTPMARADAEVESQRTGRSVAEIEAARRAGYPAGRIVTPEEVADTIAYLCSDGASGINGEAITVALGGAW